jgi:putative peptide zinc metalloprotease protein
VAVWSQTRARVGQRSWLARVSAPARALLTQRLSIKGIDRLMTAVYRAGGWLFFTRPVQVLLALLSVLGLGAFFIIVGDTRYTFLGSDVVQGLAVLWLVAILPVVIHELGHALTVKHFGREVPQGGLMLFLGMPAAFVETTDIWLEGRRARLAVTWNGPYTGLLLGGLASLIIYLFPAFSLNTLLFRMAGFSYLTFFMNVNPLLKLDGYYLLSDALEIPGLYERAGDFVRHKLLARLRERRAFTREEWIYTIFGVLSLAWFAYAMFLSVGMWNTRVSQGLQVVLGNGYPLLIKVLNLLLVLGVISLGVLILLQVWRLVQNLLRRFVTSGTLARPGTLALWLGGLALAVGLGLPLALPKAALPAAALLGGLAAALAAAQLLGFNPPFRGALRNPAQLLLAAALSLIALSQVARLFPGGGALVAGLQALALGAALLGFVVFAGRWFAQFQLWPLALGLVLGAAAVLLTARWMSVSPFEARLVLLGALLAAGSWAAASANGGARAPALALMTAGAVLTAAAWFYAPPVGDLVLTGALLLAGGALHLVQARLPELSAYTADLAEETTTVIGASAALLVRRVVAQVFFETGWPGIRRFGRQFNAAMARQAVPCTIDGNRFDDRGLAGRAAAELTNVYVPVLEELHRLVERELGRGNATLTFGYALDRLPWQYREIAGDLLFSRLAWGQALVQNLRDERDRRLRLLRRVPAFVVRPDEELAQLAGRLRAEHYAAGEAVVRQGASGDKFYIVEQGRLFVWRAETNQPALKVGELAPGQTFGERALVSNEPRAATVRAETPAVVLALSKTDFDRSVRDHLTAGHDVEVSLARNRLIREMPIFDELESFELSLLAGRLEAETFAAGEIVFREGEAGDKFYIVESGQLVAARRDAQGQPVQLSRLGPGDYLGEIALLQNRPRMATITAAEPSTVLSLKAEYFLEMMADFGAVGETISRAGSRRQIYNDEMLAGADRTASAELEV